MTGTDGLVRRLYAGFNARDIPAVFALLDANVEWVDGMHGGHLHGHAAVRDYWTGQWAAIRPQVEPLSVTRRGDGAVAVEVRQVVRDLKGALLLDETVRHVFRIEGGFVTRFDIEAAGGLSSLVQA